MSFKTSNKESGHYGSCRKAQHRRCARLALEPENRQGLAAGTIAAFIGLYIQKMLVGVAGLPARNVVVFMAQYGPSTVLYYRLLREFAFPGEHHKAAESFPRLVVVKVLHFGALYLLYRLVLDWGWHYLLALPAAGVPLVPVFYMITKYFVFPRGEVKEAEA